MIFLFTDFGLDGPYTGQVQAVLQQALGRQVFVRCFVDTAQRDNLPPGVEDDGMVAAALRDLGGEVVDFQ